jgi:hypothetical protein
MRKMSFALTLLIALAGCTEESFPASGTQSEPDQCIRAEQFQQCLKALPAGPVSTHYNDWDDVVSACRETAYYKR